MILIVKYNYTLKSIKSQDRNKLENEVKPF